MKIFLLSIVLYFMPFSAWSTEDRYPTLFLVQWTFQCSQQLKNGWLFQGYPEHLAMQLAIERCSCVIDGFRKNHTYVEMRTFDYEKTTKFAEEYTKECVFIKSNT